MVEGCGLQGNENKGETNNTKTDLLMHENLLHYWIFLTTSDAFSTRAKTGEYL